MIEIITFTEENKSYIKTLNYEWLQKYFYVEPHDEEQLSNPQFHIIDKGGYINFASFNGEIVGTSSLIKINNTQYELAKMAVTEKYKGAGIGKLLIETCIKKAIDLKAETLILFSNTKLHSAISLYKRYGFKEIPLPAELHYERANIMMKKNLNENL